ncbi:hypothetical protein ACSSS7_003356 [Eimeria intestinalis]
MASKGERPPLQVLPVYSQLFISLLIAIALLKPPLADAAAPPPYSFDFQHDAPRRSNGRSSVPASIHMPTGPGSGNFPGVSGNSSIPAVPLSSISSDFSGRGQMTGVQGSNNVAGALPPASGRLAVQGSGNLSDVLGSSGMPSAPGNAMPFAPAIPNMPGVPGSNNTLTTPGTTALPTIPGSTYLPAVFGRGSQTGVQGRSPLPRPPLGAQGEFASPYRGDLLSAVPPPAGVSTSTPFPGLLSGPLSAAQTPARLPGGIAPAPPQVALQQQATAEERRGPIALSSLGSGRAGVVSSVFGGAPLTAQQQRAAAEEATQGIRDARLVGGSTEGGIAVLAKEARFLPQGGMRRGSPSSHPEKNYRKTTRKDRVQLERPMKYNAWDGAQNNNVLVVALADTTLFQGICVSSGGRSDPRVPCGMAYPGVSTFAVHLASGPPKEQQEQHASHALRGIHASKVSSGEMEAPPLPAVLLSTAGSAGVEDAPGFADDLLFRAWVATGSGGCATNFSSAIEWGAGPTDFYTRSNANEEASDLAAKIEDVVARSLQLGSTDKYTKLMYMGNSRTSEFAALASLTIAQPKQLIGAYLTLAAEATSKSRKSRKRSFKSRVEVVPEFTFRRGPLSTRALRLDFIVTLAGRHFSTETISAVPAELQSAVSNAVGISMRELVDRYLSAAFDGKRHHSSERRSLSPELPVFFIRIQQVRLVRDVSVAGSRVVNVELSRFKRSNPMENLGTPVIFYTTAVGAAMQAYVLGHVKSAGLRDIVRQTILDARSVGPLHQPALAGYVAALREDITRLHDWLVGLAPTQSITRSVGNLSALLLKSQIAAFDLQGTCNAAVTALGLPPEDPMLTFAKQFCRVYPQTHFMQLAASEELEAYSLQWGLVAYELLGGAEAPVALSGQFDGFSLAADDSIWDENKRRRLASDESQEEEEDSFFPPPDDFTPLSEGLSGPQQIPEAEEEQEDSEQEARNSEEQGEAERSVDSSTTPSVSPISEGAGDLGTVAGAGEVVKSESFSSKNDASGLTDDSAPVQKPLESEDRHQQFGAAPENDKQQATADQLAIEKLQQVLESQRLQQQLLLQHIEAQQEQQRLIQRQQEELLNLHQQQKKLLVEQPQPTSTEAVKDQNPARAGSSGTPDGWFDSKSARVTFAGINVADEEHLIVRDSVHLKLREKSYSRAAPLDPNRKPEVMWKTLQERYGPLFLNFVSTLLSGNTLEDLIRVAEWHLDPRGNSRLCRQRRFSLFLYARRQGRFSLMRRIMGHRKLVQEVAVYMNEGDLQAWRRALEGLKRFQEFFD